MFGWLLTFQEIHHQMLCPRQRHQSLFSDHVSCPQRPSHKQSETKQSEMKYPMFEVWTKNHKPIKIFTSNTSFHIGFTVLSFVFVRNVLAPTGNRKKYHHELFMSYGAHTVRYSLVFWSNDLVPMNLSPHRGKANEKSKKWLNN